MSGSLVCIRSYLLVWEADWQRTLLTEAGIPCCVDNSSLVLWFWHYTQAVGGVKLYVDRTQLDAAAMVLAGSMPDDRAPSEAAPVVRACPQCGAELPADWDDCWRCAPPPDVNAGAVAEDETNPNESAPAGLAAAASLLLTWVLIRYGLGLVDSVGLLALVLAACAAFNQWMVGDEPSSSETVLGDEDLPDPLRRRELSEKIAQRAWQSAVFGLLWFPPLLFYAFYLLTRLGWRRFKLSSAGRARRWGAVAAILLASLRWGALLLLAIR